MHPEMVRAIHMRLIDRAAELARAATGDTRRRYALLCLRLIAEYRRRYGQEQATRDVHA